MCRADDGKGRRFFAWRPHGGRAGLFGPFARDAPDFGAALGLIDPMGLAPHAIGWSVDGPTLVTVWANFGDAVVNPGTSGDIIKIQLTDPAGGFGARDIVF